VAPKSLRNMNYTIMYLNSKKNRNSSPVYPRKTCQNKKGFRPKALTGAK
jgi:hypothetical protein